MSQLSDRLRLSKEEEDSRQCALMGAVICFSNQMARGEINQAEFMKKFEEAKTRIWKPKD
jgi:hypothetical protein